MAICNGNLQFQSAIPICNLQSEFCNFRNLGNMPAVASQRVHQIDRPLNQLARLVDFLDRLGSVGPGDDDAIVSADTIAADLVSQSLSVAIEEPDHLTGSIP